MRFPSWYIPPPDPDALLPEPRASEVNARLRQQRDIQAQLQDFMPSRYLFVCLSCEGAVSVFVVGDRNLCPQCQRDLVWIGELLQLYRQHQHQHQRELQVHEVPLALPVQAVRFLTHNPQENHRER